MNARFKPVNNDPVSISAEEFLVELFTIRFNTRFGQVSDQRTIFIEILKAIRTFEIPPCIHRI